MSSAASGRILPSQGPFFHDRRTGLAFAGGGLDRAGLSREMPDLADAWVLAVAQGQILCCGDHEATPVLGLLPASAPFFSGQAGTQVLLGQVEGKMIVARDLPPDISAPEGHGFRDLREVMTDLTPLEAELSATARGVLGWHRSHGFCASCGQRSEPVQSGWQRQCPSCGAAHFPRTDPCVIMLVTHGNDLLLGRNPNWPEGMYSCLAGFMEPGETVEAAVRREVFEETSVSVGPVRPVASQPWPFPASLMMGCHAEALSREIVTDPIEIEDALWISRERLLQVMAGRDSVIRAPRRGAIAGWLMREWLADRL
ncbi:NAD(+) diphosphatase [Thioclava sp. 'Guangxiensis']|uniref:NAD(+) diphosphatase n=1 Tax=Thioclava sp. 'Guangxiensis' TaxID=3149044 RepID=UPI003877A397